MLEPQKAGSMPFRLDISEKGPTPEQLEAQARELRERQAAAEQERMRQANENFNKEKLIDLKLLASLRIERENLDQAVKLAGKLTFAEASPVAAQYRELDREINRIVRAYRLPGIDEAQDDQSHGDIDKNRSMFPTIAQVVGGILAALIFVFASGPWILGRYPGAAIYNEVSFQKVLFSFAVVLFTYVSGIALVNMFHPGVGKYMNPFRSQSMDFFNDFKTLTPWERTRLSLALFSVALLVFAIIVSGKLD